MDGLGHRAPMLAGSCPSTWTPTARRPRSSSPRSTASTTCTTRGSRTSSRSSRSTSATRASSPASRWTRCARPARRPALIEFAVQGLIGQELKAGAAELARREAALELEWDGETVPFRSAAVLQANEPDADRRAELEDAAQRADRRRAEPAHARAAGALARARARAGLVVDARPVPGPVGHRLRRAGRADRALPGRHARTPTSRWWSPSCETQLGLGLRPAAALRPHRLLPRARRSTPASRRSASCRRSPRRWPGWASTWTPSRG